ncbi:hypothetical protein NXS08_05725 [Gleimia sp. 6138-11-ORH1]|uniref:hypothetical protein n=1 Tax=Gleimia sp. 6138-11-ORH1 TaxID=2973937 RepID=UPI00216A843A|nr:hypothetical protein [Gleimia sp. 6138-11-ORH1]MCS4484967.1 hypothetical protein [Gleimia sp. 6138-11-ORH1]
MKQERKKTPRRVVVISDADKEIASAGEAIAWDAVSVRQISQEPQVEPPLSGRDKQIQAEVPPHW